MEIKSAFYPPPAVVIPTLNIPPLKNYVYTFEKEKRVVKYYDEENRRFQALRKRAQDTAKRRDPSEPDEPESPCTSSSQRDAPSSSSGTSELLSMSVPQTTVVGSGERSGFVRNEIPVLTPQPLRPSSASSSVTDKTADLAKSSKNTAPAANGQPQRSNFHGFEEFEATTTLFDLMELKSLDDRKELEKLLM